MTRGRLREFPRDAKRNVGYQRVHHDGLQPAAISKSMLTIGRRVEDIRYANDSGAYRVIYTARLADAVNIVLSCRRRRSH